MVMTPITLDIPHAGVARLPLRCATILGPRDGVANAVIAHFFGSDWFAAHIRHDAARRGYLSLDFYCLTVSEKLRHSASSSSQETCSTFGTPMASMPALRRCAVAGARSPLSVCTSTMSDFGS